MKLKLSNKQVRKMITQYWIDFYTEGCCTLCDNSGRIDTTGVKNGGGVSVGRVNFCICPNGQQLRKHHGGHG